MRLLRILAAGILVVGLALPCQAQGVVPAPVLSARSAIVVDAEGHILFQRDAEKPLPNASTTKVLTALTVLDAVPLEDVVTISAAASRMPPSRMGVRVGERYTVLELLYAMLLMSANDASVALAEHVGGTQERFALMMNAKARALGATDTHFVTPNGLHAAGHLTTARDLALIFRVAMANPVFVAIAQTQSVDLAWPGQHENHHVRNTNKLLAAYGTPVLGKTGFTNAAGRCYVGAAQDSMLTVVMLGSRNLWRDARRLFDWGFQARGIRVPGKQG
ncbi:MAG: D-alanyl-D-alanine carboxypeptidase family protein [Candidatus Sericytochromatia bacterium]|nr:D-alanyl-D-alanine carboxypeptidase family protein [Candidatus Sericytochromatia bacterium]